MQLARALCVIAVVCPWSGCTGEVASQTSALRSGHGPSSCGDTCADRCPPGTRPFDGGCVPISRQGCNWDLDCRAVDDYCGGCSCDAVGSTTPDPFCDNPVECFAEPCAGLAAYCGTDNLCHLGPATPNRVTPSFTPDPNDFRNPERGFYVETSDLLQRDPFASPLPDMMTMVRAYVRLDNYRSQPLPPSLFAGLQAKLDAARAAGVKLILRFTYNFPDESSADAPLPVVMGHLDQLRQSGVIANNSDVIAVMEAGFIGQWGEWHDSTSGLETDAAEKAILDGVLGLLPPDRMVQLRYPRDKKKLYDRALPCNPQDPVCAAASRIGHHDDCFLSDDTDSGTFDPPPIDAWKNYVAQDALYTPTGGETCTPGRVTCAAARSELAWMHWSFLNSQYEPGALQRLAGCRDEINRNLGYRFRLIQAGYDSVVRSGDTMRFSGELHNDGYASMFNPRPVYLVITSGAVRYPMLLPAAIDPRTWFAGALPVKFTVPVTIPKIPPGRYSLALWLPDAAPRLRDNPAYAVRFANLGVWQADGLNVLGDIQVR
jgi:Domain of unknown function (DUF4832)/Domain of unknown function (DUF4874)